LNWWFDDVHHVGEVTELQDRATPTAKDEAESRHTCRVAQARQHRQQIAQMREVGDDETE